LIALGNPHLSVTECANLAKLVAATNGSKKAENTRIMACISRQVHSMADPAHVATLTNFGIEFVMDTCWCMLLDPPVVPSRPDAVIMTNSGKYAHYGPGLVQRRFRMGSLADCIDAARTGQFRYRRTTQQQHWLTAAANRCQSSSRTYATIGRRLLTKR
jgi:cis-L-3-hydroxyproline dehydratase